MHPYVYHTPVLDDTRPEKPGTHATEGVTDFHGNGKGYTPEKKVQ